MHDEELLRRRLRGLPTCLAPEIDRKEADPFSLVHNGPRHLGVRPFDYRNPFIKEQTDDPVPFEMLSSEEIWAFNYFRNGAAALGFAGGPECALVETTGALRLYSGQWTIGWGQGGKTPSLHLLRTPFQCETAMTAQVEVDRRRYDIEYAVLDPAAMDSCVFPLRLSEEYQWLGALEPSGRNPVYEMRVWGSVDMPVPGPAMTHLTYDPREGLPAGGSPSGDDPVFEALRCEIRGDGLYAITATAHGHRVVVAVLSATGCELDQGSTLPNVEEPGGLLRLVLRKSVSRTATPICSLIAPCFPIPLAEEKGLYNDRIGRYSARGIRAASQSLPLSIPETKVQDTLESAYEQMTLCSVSVEESEFPSLGPSGERHIFKLPECVDVIHAFDLLGEHERAARMLEHLWLIKPDVDTAGAALWALGEHYALTRDAQWLRGMFPEVARRVTYLMRWFDTSGGALDGLIIDPSEQGGTSVGRQLYAMAGIRKAVCLAGAVGRRQLAAQWVQFRDRLHQSILKHLKVLVDRTEGVIAPCFDGSGIDGDNLAAVYPTGVLEADHPWVSASLARWGNAYAEGLLCMPDSDGAAVLSPPLTLLLTETWLRRGATAETLRDLYGVLLHTTSAHTFAARIDSVQRTALDPMPDTITAARYIRLVRNMLAHEQGNDLHLFSCLSPAWMRPGGGFRMNAMPTAFGPLTMEGRFGHAALEVDLDLEPVCRCPQMILHAPPFLDSVHVKADSHHLQPSNGPWEIPSATRRLRIWWNDAPMPAIGFSEVVQAYLAGRQNECRSYAASVS